MRQRNLTVEMRGRRYPNVVVLHYQVLLHCIGDSAPGVAARSASFRELRCPTLSFLAEREYPFRLVDGRFRTGVRVAQELLRSARMRADAGVVFRQRLPENRPDHGFSKGYQGATQ